MYQTVADLIAAAERQHQPLWRLVLDQEMEYSKQPEAAIMERMWGQLRVMEEAARKGAAGVQSPTGLSGGDAAKIKRYRENGGGLAGDTMLWAIQNAIATNEVNAAMGVICATPTAGSSGTIPGTLFSLDQRFHYTDDEKVHFLLTAGGFGMITANNAMIAGATGGCQAEVGSASAMAAAAAVEINGGTPRQSAEAFAMAMSNLLGLVCDPVAGLVELPCVKRNVAGAVNALAAADMALAGISNRIPADEVIDAMRRIGKQMPASLRETGRGGIATTPTALKMKMRIFGEDVTNEDDGVVK